MICFHPNALSFISIFELHLVAPTTITPALKISRKELQIQFFIFFSDTTINMSTKRKIEDEEQATKKAKHVEEEEEEEDVDEEGLGEEGEEEEGEDGEGEEDLDEGKN